MKLKLLLIFLLCFFSGKILSQTNPPYAPENYSYSKTTFSITDNICSTSVVPPATINGVGVTATSSGDVGSYPSPFGTCNNAYSTPANSVYLGQQGSYVYTLNFNQPVNNLVFVLTGTGMSIDETFIFNTNAGVPSITTIGSCFSTIVGNTIYSGAGSGIEGGGGVFTITTANAFTSITISGPGGVNGSLIALCSNSVIPNTCNAGIAAPTLSTTSLTSLCGVNTINLTTITASNTPVPTGVSLAWFTTAVPSAATQLTATQIASLPSGITYYAAFFDSVNNCFSPSTPVTTVLNPIITPTFTPVDTICYGESITSLPTLSNNGISGVWSPAINNTQTTAYLFTPNTGECATTASMGITVYDDFDFTVNQYCLNNNFTLDVQPVAASFMLDNVTFSWKINNVVIDTNSIFNVTSYLNSTSTTEQLPIDFTVTVTNTNGCSKTKTITVKSVFCGIQKGISPNDDALNDSFNLKLLNVKHLSIFNRYGVKVYSKANYLDEWHGQTDKGDILPDGTYYYSIEFENEPTKTGWIYINKES